jgi:hypothetical protein
MTRHNNHLVPESANALERLKQETAQEVGVELKDYNPDLTAREAGRIGGQMVKKMIEAYERENSKY